MNKPRLLFLLAILLAVGSAHAQDEKSDTEGFFLNLHLNGTQWDLNDNTVLGVFPQESGGGLGLAFGFGASQTVTLFMQFDGSRISGGGVRDDYTLVHFDIGAMITFLDQTSRFRPFGKASFTARTAEFDLDEAEVSTFGPAFTAGAGIMAFVTTGLAVVAEGQATWGSMTEITRDDIALSTSIGARSGRLNLGLTWFPGR